MRKFHFQAIFCELTSEKMIQTRSVIEATMKDILLASQGKEIVGAVPAMILINFYCLRPLTFRTPESFE